MRLYLVSVFFVLMTVFSPLAIAETGTELTVRAAVSDIGQNTSGGQPQGAGHRSLTSPEKITLAAKPIVCSGTISKNDCTSTRGECASPCLVLQISAQHTAAISAAALVIADGEKIEGILGSDRLRPPI